MNKKIYMRFLIGSLLALSACAPQGNVTPTVDVVGTMAVELAMQMQTQTAAAASPTPLPVTDTPIPTITFTPEPTTDPTIDHVIVVITAPCYTGPGDTYQLTSNIEAPEAADLLGIGSVEGWYVIRNPTFGSACWIETQFVELVPGMDITLFPTITP
jgi:hypothetical protein